MPADIRVNIHACAVVLRDRGIVIAGEPGAGKTQLALALICRAGAGGAFGRLVSDDQVFLSVHHGRLLCVAPKTIAGLVEVRGIGPCPVGHEPGVPLDLLVRLVARNAAERFPEQQTEELLGCAVPVLKLAAGDGEAAAHAVLAKLSLPPFR